MNHKNQDNPHRYDDIISLPRPVSGKHPHMSNHDRAAQFLPFSALTGYEEAVRETARLTHEKMDLDEGEKAMIDAQLQLIRENIRERPRVTILYFLPDTRKSGGSYVEETGRVKKVDQDGQQLVMEDGARIPVDDIAGVRLEE